MNKMAQKSSILWNFFDICDNEKQIAKCNLCHQKLSFKSTITNLKKHIGRKHPTVQLTKSAEINKAEKTAQSGTTSNSDEQPNVNPLECSLPVSYQYIL